MSNSKSKAPQGGEALMTEEMKAQLALLQRAKSLGILGDLAEAIEKAEVSAKVAKTKGAVQKAVKAMTNTLKAEGITSSRLVIDWDAEGKVGFRYGPARKGGGGKGKSKVPVFEGIVYEDTKKLADAMGGMPDDYAYSEATWLKRSRKAGKVAFVWLDKVAALAAISDRKYVLAEGNSLG